MRRPAAAPTTLHRNSFAIGLLAASLAAPPAWTATDKGGATGEELFVNHCQTCHLLNPADPPRQGPNLSGVFGRKAGSVVGFPYSSGFKTADFSWDDSSLDSWLVGPQNVIAGSYMLYHQPDPAIRRKIIDFLKSRKK